MPEKPNNFWQELKRRKVIRVIIGYAAAAYVLLELTSIVAEPLGLPDWTINFVLILLCIGFVITVVVSWIYDFTPKGIEKTKPAKVAREEETIIKAPKRKLKVSDIITAVLLVVVALLIIPKIYKSDTINDTTDSELPLVVIMDSSHPTRVYDKEILDKGGTNADVISDILLDLPIRRQRETIGPVWHRDEEILKFNPYLIIIHYSGFRQDTVGQKFTPRVRLKSFINFFVESDTRFLIYSRRYEEPLREQLDSLLADLEVEHPGLLSRIDVFGLYDYGVYSWLSPITANALKLRVKEILEEDKKLSK